ncbi:MAG: hypothetical protein JXR94_24800, partial [Candidatus Hydrogenedentes bacterium]|nr:hypothetical protein [Candidatus Hydrogenedentota bacterium]
FIFCWSMFVPQKDYILMFFAITGAIWLGGAGSVIIGGLYWKRGSTVGAFMALSVGAVIAVTGIVLGQFWEARVYPFMESSMPGFLNWLTTVIEGIARAVPAINWKVTPEKFPLDGQWVNFIAIVCSLSSYIICSLVEWLVFHRPAFDMDRLLHRGKYLIKSDHISQDAKPLSGWRAALPNKEFTTGDKFLYYAKLIWTMLWFAVFVAFCAWQLGWSMPVAAWAKFWGIKVAITVVIGTGTTVWFFIGGIYDIRALFRTLGTLKRDHLDDGRVVNHHNVEDEVLIEAEDGSAGEPAGQPTGEPTDEDGAAGAGAAVEAGKKEESTGEETL